MVLGIALLLGCDQRAAAPPTEPPAPGPTPSQIEAVQPPPRSTGVPYDTEVWVRFATALDSMSVNDHNVYFLADTRRLPIALAWEPATRTLRIQPLEQLGLRQTYTVELSPALRFADGTSLNQSFISQFTTNSLRRVEAPIPVDAQRDESPFVALRWGGLTDAPFGTVLYEIHAAPDSAQAADPAQPAVGTSLAPPFVPRIRWRQDGPTYWSVHAVNSTTGERLAGPVWRFDAVPANTPYDSVLAGFSDFTFVQPATLNRCTGNELQLGPNVLCVVRWNLGPADNSVRLAGAAIEMSPQPGTPPPGADGPSVWYTTSSWAPCDARYPGPPFTDEERGRLADAFAPAAGRIRFSSDALAAHVEVTRRLGGYYGYLFRSGVTRRYWAPFSPGGDPVLWLYYYRGPPG